jgi:CheY-like chemotaxis protein
MRSVLVVDDDAAFRKLAARMLNSLGLSVAGEAASVAEAIATANDVKPDAALVDVWLPDGDGIALARKLAALPWRPRVILTSSDPDAANANDINRSGADAFVPKDRLPNSVLRHLVEFD